MLTFAFLVGRWGGCSLLPLPRSLPAIRQQQFSRRNLFPCYRRCSDEGSRSRSGRSRSESSLVRMGRSSNRTRPTTTSIGLPSSKPNLSTSSPLASNSFLVPRRLPPPSLSPKPTSAEIDFSSSNPVILASLPTPFELVRSSPTPSSKEQPSLPLETRILPRNSSTCGPFSSSSNLFVRRRTFERMEKPGKRPTFGSNLRRSVQESSPTWIRFIE